MTQVTSCETNGYIDDRTRLIPVYERTILDIAINYNKWNVFEKLYQYVKFIRDVKKRFFFYGKFLKLLLIMFLLRTD